MTSFTLTGIYCGIVYSEFQLIVKYSVPWKFFTGKLLLETATNIFIILIVVLNFLNFLAFVNINQR